MQIIVLGMHRSGSSMVTRLLNMMGAYFGPEHVATQPNEENPKGFWERRDLRGINDRLLHSTGCDWHITQGFRLGKVPAEVVAAEQVHSQQLLLDLDAHRPWVIKEPRLCLTLDFFRPLLEKPVAVLVHRRPIQVAQSLKTRDGFPLPFSIALWERYMRSALTASKAMPRVLITHEDLIADPVLAVRKLHADLTTSGVVGLRLPAAGEVRAFVDDSLFRNRGSTAQQLQLLNASQQKLTDKFESTAALQARSGGRISGGGKAVLELYEQHLRVAAKATRLRKESEALNAELGALREEQTGYRSKQTELVTKLTAERDEVALLNERQRTLQQDAKRWQKTAKDQQQQLTKLDATLIRTQTQLATASESNEQLRGEIGALQNQMFTLTAAQQQLLEQHRDTLSDGEQELREQTSLLREQTISLRQQTSLLVDQRQEQVDSVAKLQAGTRQLNEEATRGRREADAQANAVRGQLGELRGHLRQLAALVADSLRQTDLSEQLAQLRGDYTALQSQYRQAWSAIETIKRSALQRGQPRQQQHAMGQALDAIDADLQAATTPQPTLLHGLTQGIDLVFASKTWRLGKTLGRLLDLVRLRTPDPGAEPHLRQLLEQIAATQSQVGDATGRLRGLTQQALAGVDEAPAPVNLIEPLPQLAAIDATTRLSVEILIVHQPGGDLAAFLETWAIHCGHRGGRFTAVDLSTGDQASTVQAAVAARGGTYHRPNNHNSWQAWVNRAIERSSDQYVMIASTDTAWSGDLAREMLDCYLLSQPAAVALSSWRADAPGWDRAGLELVLGADTLGSTANDRDPPTLSSKCLLLKRAHFLAAGGFGQGLGLRTAIIDLTTRLSLATGRPHAVLPHTAVTDWGQQLRPSKAELQQLRPRLAAVIRRQALRRLSPAHGPLRVGILISPRLTAAARTQHYLAQALQAAFDRQRNTNCVIVRLGAGRQADHLDLLISLTPKLDPAGDNIPATIRAAWVGEFPERWFDQGILDSFDLICAASKAVAHRVKQLTSTSTVVLHLAHDYGASDGNPWAATNGWLDFLGVVDYRSGRTCIIAEAAAQLDAYSGAVLGSGWSDHPQLAALALPDSGQLYRGEARARVTIWEPPPAQRQWAIVPPWVDHVLLAGGLVITNSRAAAEQGFEGKLPVYASSAELLALLERYAQPGRSFELITELQAVARGRSGTSRARRLRDQLRLLGRRGLRWSIKAADKDQTDHDDHAWCLAQELASQLRARHQLVRVDTPPQWHNAKSGADEVVVCMPTASNYQPAADQVTLIWSELSPAQLAADSLPRREWVAVQAERLISTARASIAELTGQV